MLASGAHEDEVGIGIAVFRHEHQFGADVVHGPCLEILGDDEPQHVPRQAVGIVSGADRFATAQHTVVKICNRGAANSQIGGALSGTNSAGATALPVSAINTGSDWYIVFTGQKAVSGDSLKLEQYQVVNQPF
jgi:hypothetical protein